MRPTIRGMNLSVRSALKGGLLASAIAAGTVSPTDPAHAAKPLTRSHIGTQEASVVIERVRKLVSDALAPWRNSPDDPVISVGALRHTRLPNCDDPQPFISAGTVIRSGFSVGVRCLSPKPWTTYVPVTVDMSVSYLVARRTILVGTVLSQQDLLERKASLDRLPRETSREAEVIIGRVASRRIAMGQPIRPSMLTAANSIVRGQSVRIVVRGSGFSVSGEGQALTAAQPGSNIQIRLPTGQVITGQVQDKGTVHVVM